jgi:cellulose synthase/poly-beta-1,6-N-acetylglucosamine synthase-like glycosyltransferase
MMAGYEVESAAGGDVGEAVYLSIIIPAYNEAQRIGESLQTILAYLRQQPEEAGSDLTG